MQGLVPVNDFRAGDTLVIHIQDGDQNLDPTTAETIEVTVTSSLGDTERIQLTETTVNDEYFIGYIQTTTGAIDNFDCQLAVKTSPGAPAGSLVATYTDQFDASDVATFTALVDPFGIIFDSTTGAAIDGATVRLFEDTGGGTLVPATVFGDDGISAYPNVLTSGSTATDASSTVYNFPAGGYRFPLIAPGNYRLVVTPPTNYLSPSQVSIATLQALPGAPFALSADGSFEQTFTVNPGPPVHIDIPLDPLASNLIVEKSADQDNAALGDFVQYRINIENVDPLASAVDVVLHDRLPVGFRYQNGSAFVDGVQIADPIIASNGRDLAFNIGTLAANGGQAQLEYVVEIAAGTRLGGAINTAFATDSGGAQSNTSQHEIQIADDLLRTNGILVGRVMLGNCPELPPGSGMATIAVSGDVEAQANTDLLNYVVDIELEAVSVRYVRLHVDLPAGVNYNLGSATLDGLRISDPNIEDNALSFRIGDGNFWPKEWKHQLRFSAQETEASARKKSINVQAFFDTEYQANQSTGIAKWSLGKAAANIESRVVAYSERNEKPTTGLGLPGVEGVKLYLEDGTFVNTDKDGKYHFEGLQPGTHVVQIDKESLPSNIEIMSCEKNTRFAGTPYSRFVDMAGGSLWRADFYLREKAPITDYVELGIASTAAGERVRLHIDNKAGIVAVNNYRLTVMLPNGMHYVPGSTHIDGVQVKDPQVFDTVLIYRLGDLGENWQKSIYFDADISVTDINSLLTVKALATFASKDEKNIRTSPIATSIDVTGAKKSQKGYTFKPKFPVMSTDLINVDKANLNKIIVALNKLDVKRITVVGHTDNQAIRQSSQSKYKDNYALSRARAQSIADYLREKMLQQGVEFIVQGVGPDQPIADNKTADGRSQNRRVDIIIDTVEIVKKAEFDVKDGQTTKKAVSVKRIAERNELPMVDAAKKLHIEAFDKVWLDKQNADVEWLMPADGFIPATPSINIAIKHHANHTVEAKVADEDLNPLFFFGRIKNSQGTVARSYWQGIHLDVGPNQFTFTVRDEQYNVIEVIEKNIHYSGLPVKVELVEKYSRLLADGVNNPVIAVRFYDRWNQPLRAGVTGEFKVAEPYLADEFYDALKENELSGLDRENPLYKIGNDGIALIELVPTTETGVVELRFDFPNQIQRTLKAWLKPKSREWILVGLAEGQVAINDISGNEQNATDNDYEDDTLTDGRLAFFAKGQVKGDWLLTASYDSDKETNSEIQERLFSVIDPDEYYTLYGDDTRQGYDAASSDKLYVRIEKEKFYALYGDYNTDLNETELSKYERGLTGLKTEYEDKYFVINAFAAETNNRFIKDEIPGDGTSGLYQLSAVSEGLILNSERIAIETRDRFQSEVIVERRELRRHLDYNIDYANGTIFFKEPIPNRDFNFNPVFIVAEYEVNTPVEGEITSGLRAAVKLQDNTVEIGVTAIDDQTFAAEGQLQGIDLTYKVTPSSEVTVEYASSEQNQANTATPREGDAYLLQYEIADNRKRARAYLRENESGFGLGQQNGSESGTRKTGVEGQYAFTNQVRVEGQYFTEENLDTNPVREREVLTAALAYTQPSYGVSAGITLAEDRSADGSNQQESELLDLGAYQKFFDGKLLTRIDRSQSLDSNDNSDFSNRTIIGADYNFYKNINLFAEYEVTDSNANNAETSNSRIGLRSSLWQRTEIRSTVEQQETEDGLRVFANLGLTQSFVINDRWSADAVYESSNTLSDSTRTTFDVDSPPASGTRSNAGDFDALSLGSTYKFEKQEVVGRVESRHSRLDDKLAILFGWKRDYVDGLGLSIRLQTFDTDFDAGGRELNSELRFSTSYRPISSRWIHLNRLDYITRDSRDATGVNTDSRKVVNNWKSNFLYNRTNQFAFSYGHKDVLSTIDQNDYSGVTQFFGVEYRHDLSHILDIGAQVSRLQSSNAGLAENAYGLSLGWTFARNTWLSVGYNFEGFTDSDFADADYSVDGLYIKIRFKFDQDTFNLNR